MWVCRNRGHGTIISDDEKPTFKGYKGTEIILGHRDNKKTSFAFGNRGTNNFTEGEQEKGYVLRLEGLFL